MYPGVNAALRILGTPLCGEILCFLCRWCLALVWQLMKAYTLRILAKLAGKDEMGGQTEGDDIVNWVNSKV